MKINYLSVSGYKNLKETEIHFSFDGPTIAIVGNNGTGKSNLIEALLHVFFGLYYNNPPKWGFKIEYEAHGKFISAESPNDSDNFTVTVNGHPWSRKRFSDHAKDEQSLPPFPSFVFGYYSGTCKRIERSMNRHKRTYAAKLKNNPNNLHRTFVFSSIDQAKLIAASLFGRNSPDILRELSISSIDSLKLTFRTPDTFRSEVDDPKFWGIQGALREFMADIDAESSEFENKTKIHETKDGRSIEERTYVLRKDGLDFLSGSTNTRRTNTYSILQALKAQKILIDIKCTFIHENGKDLIDFDELSEGEKQLISVIGGISLSDNDECLILLDEPDTHLNPAWSTRYCELVRDALTKSQAEKSTVVLATHDPVLISDLKKGEVLVAENQGDRLNYHYPAESPQGQGFSGILTSDMFGLNSTLDQSTSKIISERRLYLEKDELSPQEAARLRQLNELLDNLGYSYIHPDEDYRQFLIARRRKIGELESDGRDATKLREQIINGIITDSLAER